MSDIIDALNSGGACDMCGRERNVILTSEDMIINFKEGYAEGFKAGMLRASEIVKRIEDYGCDIDCSDGAGMEDVGHRCACEQIAEAIEKEVGE